MARRDNQGIQIAMIVFILTTLVFMVTTYFGWSSSQRLQAEVNELRSSLDTANSGLSQSERLVASMKRFSGLPEETDNSAVEAALQEAVLKFGQGLPVENQNFSDISARLTAQVQDLNRKLAQASDLERQLRGELDQTIKTQGEIAAAAQAAETKAVEDLNAMRQQFQAERTKKDTEMGQLAQRKDTLERAQSDLVAKTTAEVAQVRDELNVTKNILDARNDELNELKIDQPDQFDGEVVGVVVPTGTVWLNVGRADGLQPKTLFSIYDADESNVRSAKKKASIEVTRILGDHRAEARITDTDYLAPIVPGDFVFSPIWSPGVKLGVALLGKMDVDKDGTDDRAYIRNLIELNGARIDAEDVNGAVQGQMTVNTRFIVVGDTSTGDGGSSAAATPMLDDAARLGIERTSLDELLELMGFVGRARTESFAGVVRPGDFAPKPEGGVTRVSGGDTSFTKRTPLRRRNQATPAY